MKKLLLSSLMLMVLVQSAKAENFPWKGSQVMFSVGGAVEMIENKLFVRGSGIYFWVPENGLNMFFVYFGPKWQIADWIWIAPQVGFAGNWTLNSKDAADFSLWTGLSFFQSRLTVFLEGDAIVNHDQQDYYGYYSIDYNPLSWLNAGIQGEQINKGVMFGPHLGYTNGPLHLEVQYYAGFQQSNKGHTIRFFTRLFF